MTTATLKSRIERVTEDHPDFAEQRKAIAAGYVRREAINDEYCEVQGDIEAMEEELSRRAKAWCSSNPEVIE